MCASGTIQTNEFITFIESCHGSKPDLLSLKETNLFTRIILLVLFYDDIRTVPRAGRGGHRLLT